MSRYPNEDVERFDQQFAGDDDERVERFRLSALRRQLCELTSRWTTFEDIPQSQQNECREIGKKLNALGGMNAMRAAYYQAKGQNAAVTVIQAYWDGVGDWQW